MELVQEIARFIFWEIVIFFSLIAAWAFWERNFNEYPSSISEGYLLDDDGYKWQRAFINFFRANVALLPIWLIPARKWNLDNERDLLIKSCLLYDEVKTTIKRCEFSSSIKKSLLNQCFFISQNIANGLWKVASLRRLVAATDGIEVTKKHRLENTDLQNQIFHEMEFLVERLSFLSLSLLKSEINRDTQIIEGILLEISSSNAKLKTIMPPVNTYNKITRTSSAYYIIIFLVLLTAFTVTSIYAPTYALPTIIVGSLIGFIAIGLFQLRNDENIKDKSFTRVIIEILKTIRLIK